ncbi:hypothetical protein CKM354_000209700 [Cercospora kikuchii]|uniref:Heterokaryon incompatibility domain-containing protein n=1 Tax=Cercospora kikuchii TaxID=84275 RepID=A0A9P3CE21_9PEZI|nr:uncharacterized protein CKM354_000209700 [Cercospora kikuchii]GIZ38690.1 hypothetical protein CKM354_000209700 [Cercospora kikuchii]
MPPLNIQQLRSRIKNKLHYQKEPSTSKQSNELDLSGPENQSAAPITQSATYAAVEHNKQPLLPSDFDEETVSQLDAALCAECQALDIGRLFNTNRMTRSNPYAADFSASPEGCVKTTFGRLTSSSSSCACCKLILDCFVRQREMQDISLDVPLTIMFDPEKKQVIATTDHDSQREWITLGTAYCMYCREAHMSGLTFLLRVVDDWVPLKDAAYNNDRPLKRLIEHCPTVDKMSDRIQQWLELCPTECHTCSETSSLQLPTRLLDVAKASDVIRLIESANLVFQRPPGRYGESGVDITKTAQYVALSYCWGTAGQYTLNQSTYSDLLRGVNVDVLPKTTQDAIQLTRALGVRYLWIDALCIFQGEDEPATRDWQEQSAMMSTIYENAYLTLMASRSTSVHDGFLKGRTTCHLGVFCGSVQTDGSRKPIFLFDEASRSRSLDNILESEPLTKRGWAFQERILSRRSVIFGSKQMYWNCRKHERAENEDWMVSWGGSRSSSWTQIVQDYTPCRLTKPSDRLPALSGLAAIYLAKHYGNSPPRNHYFAGHWRETILETLLWHPPMTAGGAMQAFGYQAPSWSWVSCDGPIHWEDQSATSEPVAALLDVNVTIDGHNPFGQVKAGSLDILAPFIMLEHGILTLDALANAHSNPSRRNSRYPNPLIDNEDQTRIYRLRQDDLKILFPVHTQRLEDIYDQTKTQLNPEYSDSDCLFAFDKLENTCRDNLCLLPVFREEAIGNESYRLSGLILCESRDKAAIYQRVGIFRRLPDFLPLDVERVVVRIV